MLKLERSSKNDRQVSVIVRNQEHWLTQPLQIGLAIAIAFHLLFFTLFQIVPFQFPANSFVFPPVTIEVPANSHTSMAALTEKVQEIVSELPPRPATVPPLPNSPQFTRVYPREAPQVQPTDAFTQIEEEVYTPTWKQKSAGPSLRWIVSGPLADRPLLHSPTVHPKVETHATYQVMVDNRTGKIFWFNSIDTPSNAATSQWLSAFQFATDQDAFVTEGFLEIHFIPESDSANRIGVRPDILTFVIWKGEDAIPMFGISPLPNDECQNVRPDPNVEVAV